MQCQVNGCSHEIAPSRIRRIGARRVKTCSSFCSALYAKQTGAQRVRDYWERQEDPAEERKWRARMASR